MTEGQADAERLHDWISRFSKVHKRYIITYINLQHRRYIVTSGDHKSENIVKLEWTAAGLRIVSAVNNLPVFNAQKRNSSTMGGIDQEVETQKQKKKNVSSSNFVLGSNPYVTQMYKKERRSKAVKKT